MNDPRLTEKWLCEALAVFINDSKEHLDDEIKEFKTPWDKTPQAKQMMKQWMAVEEDFDLDERAADEYYDAEDEWERLDNPKVAKAWKRKNADSIVIRLESGEEFVLVCERIK